VLPGYHMNKKHWNTIIVDGTTTNKLLQQWIIDSYNLVADGLTKKEKEKLNSL
jgi:predicted DNA-binding protein (MmcQ/YjbR family)